MKSILSFTVCCYLAMDPAYGSEFPHELTKYSAYEKNPLFSGRGPEHWDTLIRERGWIMKENGKYHLWYTGYVGRDTSNRRMLGYATSDDGIQWTRYSDGPIHRDHWVEDMMVLKHDGIYYMFAEGERDIAHLLTSRDRVHWNRVGLLTIRKTDGTKIPGPYGTPLVWLENGKWRLFYERGDKGIWLATSKDRLDWTNVQDEPVIACGPEKYDKYAVALNQIVRYKGRYYAHYHASDTPQWLQWTTNIAVSDDLVHWEKYSGNPLLRENKSSGILVPDGSSFRLYTMHPQVQLHFPHTLSKSPPN